MPVGIHMCGWCVFEHKHSSHVILDCKGQRLYCSIVFPGWWWKDGDDQVALSTINKPQCYFRQVGQLYFTAILVFIAKFMQFLSYFKLLSLSSIRLTIPLWGIYVIKLHKYGGKLDLIVSTAYLNHPSDSETPYKQRLLTAANCSWRYMARLATQLATWTVNLEHQGRVIVVCTQAGGRGGWGLGLFSTSFLCVLN